ncbi:permease [Haloarchaeobius amylolyticus]|uniref:permease n=1 Tax=Haloarchaeobius amylolyticus TaxID=1198296 RepID=UPI00226E1C09|nr:permease [Haloarchaeobius amylolyticus]
MAPAQHLVTTSIAAVQPPATLLGVVVHLVVGTLAGLWTALRMAWDTWWALVLGFTLTGAVEQFVTAEQLRRHLGEDDWRSVALGTLLGAASSSCSFSAVATSKNLFKKGASPAASLGAFQFASTDLVVEIGLAMWVLLGWQFVAADFFGGIVAVAVLAWVYVRLVPEDWFEEAREHVREVEAPTCAACGMVAPPDDADTVVESVESGTAYFCCGGCRGAYDPDRGQDRPSLLSTTAWRRAAGHTMKEWDMLWDDIVLGFLVAGLLAGLVPTTWWTALFGLGGPTGGFSWVVTSVVVGVVVGIATFLCSVGNVPFALVLWTHGVAFGGVLSFIFADLVIPPIVDAYRRYYGGRLAGVMFLTTCLAAVVAGVAVHYVFGGLGLIPPAGQVGGTAPDALTVVLNLLLTPVFLVQVYVGFGPAHLRAFARDNVVHVAGALFYLEQAVDWLGSLVDGVRGRP